MTEKQELSKPRILLLAFLVILATYVTLYSIMAYRVACHVTRVDNTTYWRTTASGSFFPWPNEPGMAQALSEMNPVDKFIYLYLIETGMLIVISILFWALAAIYFFKSIQPLFQLKLAKN